MFKSARLKLTAYYLAIIMLISISFSAVVYRALDVEIQRFSRMQRYKIEQGLRNGFFGSDIVYRAIPVTVVDEDLLKDTRRRVLLMLTAINTAILASAGILGYYLAGRTLQPIQQMVDQQYRFISDASHELKTPITALRTSIEVSLREKRLTGREAKKILSDNLTDVIGLQHLSEGLLELTNGSHTPILRPVVLKNIIETAMREVRPLAKAKEITIHTSGNLETTIVGDDRLLQRAIVAVLDNAIKYSRAKTSVQVAIKELRAHVHIIITDHGIGIRKKDLSRVTDRFYRADTSRSANGYGLGLSIVDKIMRTQGGTLAIKSKLNLGTSVTLRLPLSA